MTRDELRGGVADSIAMLQAVHRDDALIGVLEDAVARCCAALATGGKLLIAGNGGSAADAQHWAGELVARFNYDRPGLAAIALSTDTSILTAVGNDYGYDYVFARQVEALGRAGDVLIALSTSGNSPNVLRAVAAASERGLGTIGFTGRKGGRMAERCDLVLRMPAERTPLVQEGHAVLGHLLCAAIERRMHPRNPDSS